MTSNIQLSIIIPCFNEKNTLEEVIEAVVNSDKLGMTFEIILVDDGSSDESKEIISALSKNFQELQVKTHEKNFGKGAALKTGIKVAKGEIILVQDADLEYDTSDYPRLLKPFMDGKADVVFGSRFKSSEAGRVLYFWHSVGNRLLTFLSNMMTNLNLTDMETGYKVFRIEILNKLDIKEKRFGVEPEFVAKIAKLKPLPRIYEVGISYFGRTYEEGKKIGWKDALRALYCIFKYKFLD